jgi:hypothetical protein
MSSGGPSQRLQIGMVGFTAIFVAVGAATAAKAATGSSPCTPSQVRLTVTRVDNAFTGGSYLVARSVAECEPVVGRLCDGAKAEMTKTILVVGAYGQTQALRIQACRRQGAVIYTGPFAQRSG